MPPWFLRVAQSQNIVTRAAEDNSSRRSKRGSRRSVAQAAHSSQFHQSAVAAHPERALRLHLSHVYVHGFASAGVRIVGGHEVLSPSYSLLAPHLPCQLVAFVSEV